MRPPFFILVLVLPLVAACDSPFGPDKSDTRGTRLTIGQRHSEGTLAWVPGSELVAFISSPQTGGCAIKTVNVASGSTTVIDDDCGTHFLTEPPLRNLVVASDGSALYYSVGGAWVNGGASRNLRVADRASGEVTTLRSDVPQFLALSPDRQQLAYKSLGDSTGQHDSLIVRDLSNGVEMSYGTGIGSPILFSPDGTELLYQGYQGSANPFTVRRLSLSDGRSEPVSLPDAGPRWLFHWDDSGLRVFSKSGIDYHVHNLTTGDSIHVGVDFLGTVSGGRTWSTDGTRVSYWTSDCLESGGFACLDWRLSLFVADTRSGSRVRVAYTKAGRVGPTVFSPDGRRIVYSLDGDLYISEVP